MPDLMVTMPDGRKARWSGDKPPTAADLDALYKNAGGQPQPAKKGFLRSAAEGFDPRRREGRENLAGMVGSFAGEAAAVPLILGEAATTGPGAAVVGPVTMAGMRSAGASTAGALEAGAENLYDYVTGQGKAPGAAASDIGWAAARQGGYQAGGEAVMLPLQRFGRLALGSKVGEKAVETLKAEGKAARETAGAYLRGARNSAGEAFRTATEAIGKRATEAKQMADELVAGAKTSAEGLVSSAQAMAREQRGKAAARLAGARSAVSAATKSAAARVAEAEQAGAEAIQRAEEAYQRQWAKAPSTVETGKAVTDVLGGLPGVRAEQGPAKRALDAAGRKVKEAAQSGPELPTSGVRSFLEDVWRKAYPSSIFPGAQKATKANVGFGGPSPAQLMQNSLAAAAKSGKPMSEEVRAQFAKMIGVDEGHPLPALLARIVQAPEKVSFADMHALKEELQSATNFDVMARNRVKRITKAMAGKVRETMAEAGHAAYEEATAAYRSIIPLYTEGIGKRIIKAAAVNPDAVAQTLKATSPSAAQATKDLLLHQAEAGGDAAAGQRAWDAVRSSFLYNNIISGGAKGLASRIAKLRTENPEFVRVVLGDETGTQVLDNLHKIGTAWEQAQAAAEKGVAGAKEAGRESIAAAKERLAAARGVATTAKQQAREGVAAATQQAKGRVAVAEEAGQRGVDATKAEASPLTRESRDARFKSNEAARKVAGGIKKTVEDKFERFKKSSLGPLAGKDVMTSELADVIRAAGGAGGLHSVWSGLSLLRLITRNAKMEDVLEWAAYSNANTNKFLTFLTGKMPNKQVPALIRGILSGIHGQQANLPTQLPDFPPSESAATEDAGASPTP